MSAAVSYDEHVAGLTAHFDPHLSEVYNCALFFCWDQLPGESVSLYTAALQELAADCNFGTVYLTTRLYANSTMLPLDVMLQDRFVCGLRCTHIQQHLYVEQDMSF